MSALPTRPGEGGRVSACPQQSAGRRLRTSSTGDKDNRRGHDVMRGKEVRENERERV